MNATITSKGQLTLPKAAREYLGLQYGDSVTFFIQVDGTVALLPKRPATVMRGKVKAGKRPVTLDEMNAAIRTGATARSNPKTVKRATAK